MGIENYLLFIVASIVLCIVPGPDMIFLLSRTVAQGRKAGIMAAIGINVGAYVHLLGVVVGVSAVLMASAYAFTVLKWAGAAYLIYIGIQTLISKQSPLVIDDLKQKPLNKQSVFWQGFLSDVLNPKVAIFFLAFLPQFINPDSGDRTMQILFLGCTVNIIAILINIVLVFSASALTKQLRKSQKASAWLTKIMGGIFIALGLRLANEKI